MDDSGSLKVDLLPDDQVALRAGDRSVDVPLEGIPGAARAEVRAVQAQPTLRRPLTVRPVAAPVAVYRRLLDELPLAAEVVRSIGAGSYTIREEADGIFHIDDGRGASARVERLERRPGVRVYFARGAMQLPVLPTIRGRGLITLRYAAKDGGTLTGGQIYFRLDSRAIHAIARRVAPLLYGAIDERIARLTEAALEACRHVATREPAPAARR